MRSHAMPLRHDSAAHGGPAGTMPTYVCLFCDAPWPYAQVQSLARCRDCGGPLAKSEPPREGQAESAA